MIIEIVEATAVLAGDLNNIFEPVVGDQSRAGAFFLENGVGRNRRAMHQVVPAFTGNVPNPLQHGLGRVGRSRQQLVFAPAITIFPGEIGKCSPRINTYDQHDHPLKWFTFRKPGSRMLILSSQNVR